MYRHRRTDLASRRGELSASTSKHGAVVVIAKGQRSDNYSVVVHLADEHENSPLNSTQFNI